MHVQYACKELCEAGKLSFDILRRNCLNYVQPPNVKVVSHAEEWESNYPSDMWRRRKSIVWFSTSMGVVLALIAGKGN